MTLRLWQDIVLKVIRRVPHSSGDRILLIRILNTSIQPQQSLSASSDASDSGIRSFFGRMNYSYNNRYIASFSGRFDSSSKFGENNRTGFFPSASLAWRIGEEDFMDNLKSLSEFKDQDKLWTHRK